MFNILRGVKQVGATSLGHCHGKYRAKSLTDFEGCRVYCIFTARQRSWGRVMFSVVCVCLVTVEVSM